MTDRRSSNVRNAIQTPEFDAAIRGIVRRSYGDLPPERVEDIRQDVIAAMLERADEIRSPFAYIPYVVAGVNRAYRRHDRLITIDPTTHDLLCARNAGTPDIDILDLKDWYESRNCSDQQMIRDRVSGQTFKELGDARGYSLWTARREFLRIIRTFCDPDKEQ